MAVRAHAYARQGGMNRRQAGEDFYFMQKLVDGEQVENIAEATVFPSARLSHRVPFGTGKALSDAVEESVGCWLLFAKDLCRSQGVLRPVAGVLPIWSKAVPRPALGTAARLLAQSGCRFTTARGPRKRRDSSGFRTSCKTLAQWISSDEIRPPRGRTVLPHEEPNAAVSTLNAWIGQREPKRPSLKGWLTHFRLLERTI